MTVFGVEGAGEFVAVFGSFLLLVVTTGTAMAAWALRELVRLTNAVTKLEAVLSSIELRIEALEERFHERWPHPPP